MTLDMGNTDKLAHVCGGGQEVAASPSCRPASTPPRSISSPSPRSSGQPGAIRYSLAALEEHRRRGRRDASSPSARRRAVPGPRRLRRRAATPRRSTSARWRRWPPPVPSTRSSRTARWCTATSNRSWRWRNAASANAAQGTDDLFGGGRRRRPQTRPASSARPGRRWSGCSTSSTPSASSSRAIRSMPTSACCRSSASQRYAEFEAADRARRDGRAGLPASSSRRASGARRRATSSPSPCSRTPPASSRR